MDLTCSVCDVPLPPDVPSYSAQVRAHVPGERSSAESVAACSPEHLAEAMPKAIDAMAKAREAQKAAAAEAAKGREVQKASLRTQRLQESKERRAQPAKAAPAPARAKKR